VFRDAVAPIEAYERALIESVAPLIAERQQERRIAEAAVKKAEAAAVNSENVAAARVEALSALRALGEIQVPAVPRLIADDTTLEALTSLLVDQGGRMAVMAAEGKLFDIAAGIYSSKGQPVNHDVLLKGHAGESLRVDRKGRAPEHVANAAVTLGLAVQPYKIDDLVKVHGAVDSGLVARMLFALPKSFIGWREQVTRPVPADVAERYEDLVLRSAEYFDALRSVGQPMVLRLESKALDRFTEFRRAHEVELRPGGRLAVIRAWASKLPGAVLRIAGLLEVSKSNGGASIGFGTLSDALQLADYLTAHALAVYDRAGADRVTSAARKSIEFLLAHPDGFTERDFYKDRFSKEDAGPVLQVLEDHLYIWRVQGERPGSKGGRPKSDRFEVNPYLLATEPTQPTQPVDDGSSVGCVDGAS
ncbi:MAG: YfjI family protein, partial [Acidimicrobiia bacterium]